MENPSGEKLVEFGKELEHLINRHSMENTCDTPDFIIAAFLLDCLQAFAKATKRREEWYGGWPKNAATASSAARMGREGRE